MALSFNLTKVSDAISGDVRVFQSHLSSAGVCDAETLAADVAAKTKDSVAVVLGTMNCMAEAIGERLMQGERVVWDGVCRFELYAEGSFEYEDSPWDPAKNRIVVRCIPSDAVKAAAAGVDVVNEISPTVVQIYGVQDRETLAENELTQGHTALLQGKGLRQPKAVNLVRTDDPSVVVSCTVTHSTAGTLDFTVPADCPPADYRLDVIGNDGKSDDYMPVTAYRTGIRVVAAA